jgi:tungstate transport system substrate-binding protein
MAVNPARYPGVNYQGAMAFIAWLTSPEGKNLIASFKVDDESLFFPDAIQTKQVSPK